MFVLIPAGNDECFEVHHITDTGVSFTGLSLQKEGVGWRTVANGSYDGYADLHVRAAGGKHFTLSSAVTVIKCHQDCIEHDRRSPIPEPPNSQDSIRFAMPEEAEALASGSPFPQPRKKKECPEVIPLSMQNTHLNGDRRLTQ